MDRKNKNPKILFYAGNGYSFKSWPIWQFYEVCQKYQTVLLSEKLDQKTEEIINNKKLFPKLEKIIILDKSSDATTKEIVAKNNFLHSKARKIIDEVKPDILVTIGRNVYPFCLYLRRYARKRGARNICVLYPQGFPTKEMMISRKLQAASSIKSDFLPKSIKTILGVIKKWAGHLLYYWLLPLAVFEKPFIGEPGMIFRPLFGKTVDIFVVFSKKDFNIFSAEGLDKEKLIILKQPYPAEFNVVNDIFVADFLASHSPIVKDPRKKLVWMYPNSKTGCKKGDFGSVSEKDILETRKKILSILVEEMKDWQIIIKTHPHINPVRFQELKNSLSSFSNVVVVDPKDWAEGYIHICDMILGSAPRSLTLYAAEKMYPQKIIVSLDFNKELLGDTYKDSDGIEYIDSKEGLEKMLNLIKSGEYRKRTTKSEIVFSTEREFASFSQIIDNMF